MPLARRVPKRGFSNKRFRTEYCVINVSQLDVFEDGETVDLASLRQKGMARSHGDGIKVLGNGELTTKLTVQAHAFSASAVKKIQDAGGEAVQLEGKLRKQRKAVEGTPTEPDGAE